MADNRNPNRDLVRSSGSFFQDLTNRFHLISRLLMDSRVNPLIKILPVATLAYVISPVDFLPVNPVDDAFVIWVGTTLFVELCPPNVVDEHLQAIKQRKMNAQSSSTQTPDPGRETDVIDGEFFETDVKRKEGENIR